MPYIQKSITDKWQTPIDFYNKLNEEFHFNFDPCPIDWNQGDADGLKMDWGTITFCNPPYSQTKFWIKKAHDEWVKGKTVVMLINACTDTVAFHEYVLPNAEIRFIRGRLCFINPLYPLKKTPNPKASILCIFKHDALGNGRTIA